MVLLLLSSLAALVLLALLFKRVEPLARLGERAASRLDQGRAVPTLWGLAACVFLLLASAALFATKFLALLGALLLLAGFALASLGLAVAALSLGQRLLEASGAFDTETLPALRLGLWVIGLASFLPLLGWLLGLLTIASGVGAALEMFAARRQPTTE